ncbi:MAG TPA: tetratricopeptide repeat protein [Candidatus Obscuribacterales bacterium]
MIKREGCPEKPHKSVFAANPARWALALALAFGRFLTHAALPAEVPLTVYLNPYVDPPELKKEKKSLRYFLDMLVDMAEAGPALGAYVGGERSLDMGRYPQAIEEFTRELAKGNVTADVYRQRGYAYAMLRKFDRAAADFTSALKLEPIDVVTMHNRVAALKRLGKSAEAQKDVAYMERLGVTRAVVRQYERAIAFLDRGQSMEALELLQPLRPKVPREPYLYTLLAQAAALSGGIPQARQYLTQAIKLAPHLGYLYHARGLAAAKQYDYENALSDLTKAVSISPDRYWTMELSSLKLMLGDTKGALNLSDQVLMRHPRWLQARAQRIQALRLSGRFQEALAECANALKLATRDEERVLILASEAELCLKKNIPGRGLAALDKALQINKKSGGNAEGNLSLLRARLYTAMGRHAEAETDYDAAIKLNAEDGELYFLRARCLQRQQKFERAVLDLTSALKVDPEHGDRYYPLRAALYDSLNMKRLADADRQAARKFNERLKKLPQMQR